MANAKQQKNAAGRAQTKAAQGKPVAPKPEPRPSKGQDSAKVHDTKGKNNHGRSY